jgi:hypothetical protein
MIDSSKTPSRFQQISPERADFRGSERTVAQIQGDGKVFFATRDSHQSTLLFASTLVTIGTLGKQHGATAVVGAGFHFQVKRL